MKHSNLIILFWIFFLSFFGCQKKGIAPIDIHQAPKSESDSPLTQEPEKVLSLKEEFVVLCEGEGADDPFYISAVKENLGENCGDAYDKILKSRVLILKSVSQLDPKSLRFFKGILFLQINNSY